MLSYSRWRSPSFRYPSRQWGVPYPCSFKVRVIGFRNYLYTNMGNVKKQILVLRGKGYSYQQIQEELGCSKGTIAYHVGVGQIAKTNQRTRDKRSQMRRLIQDVKTNKRCVDCGEDYPHWILEFDHLRDKDFTIGACHTHTLSLDILQREIEKCDIVCANCHKTRTFLRKVKTGAEINWQHGSVDIGTSSSLENCHPERG